MDDIEVQRRYLGVVNIVAGDQNVTAVQLGGTHCVRVQTQPQLIHQILGDLSRVVGDTIGHQSGETGHAVVTGDARQTRFPGIEFRALNLPVAVAELTVDIHRRATGDIGPMIDQVLSDPVPAAVFEAAPILVHATEFNPGLAAQVGIERRLQDCLIGRVVVVVAVGRFQLAIQVEARRLVQELDRASHFAGQHALVPAASGITDRACGAFQVLSGFGASRFGNEVQRATHLAGARNRRHGATNYIYAIGSADGSGVVTLVVESLDPAEIVFGSGAADIE